MGSVKDMIIPGGPEIVGLDTKRRELAEKLYIKTEPHKFGQGAWKVSGRFSVADLKKQIPPVEIDSKNYILTMMTASYFEHAENIGLGSCYLGLMDSEGNVVDTTTLLDRGELSDIIVMQLANIPKAGTVEAVKEYHEAIKQGDISVYVADAESIFRGGFPLGSSSFKKMFKYTGRGDIYEKIATYDETVQALDEIRADVAEKGLDSFPDLKGYLEELTLGGTIPNPGAVLESPVLNFTTKFSVGGDEDVTEDEARARMGVDEKGYEIWKGTVRKCANDQMKYDGERNIKNMDGKVEGVVYDGGKIKLTDFAKTPDENREMILVEKNGIEYLVPTNKEIQRAVFRARGIYQACDDAKAEAQKVEGNTDNWHNYLLNHTTKETLQSAADDSCAMMADALKVVGNRALGTDIFDARPVDAWVDEFLPYASRVQKD